VQLRFKFFCAFCAQTETQVQICLRNRPQNEFRFVLSYDNFQNWFVACSGSILCLLRVRRGCLRVPVCVLSLSVEDKFWCVI
jgi:hypothetical protein